MDAAVPAQEVFRTLQVFVGFMRIDDDRDDFQGERPALLIQRMHAGR